MMLQWRSGHKANFPHHRKGGWGLTRTAMKLRFYRVPGKTAILIDSSLRCPPLRELTDCLSAFLPERFEDVTRYANYEHKYTRERKAFSINIKTQTLFEPVKDWKGLQNMSLYARGGAEHGFGVQYGFPFASMQQRWVEDEMPAARRYRLEGTELMGTVVMCRVR